MMPNKKYLKTSGVRMRSEPETSNDHNIIDKAREGLEVTILKEEGGWSEVEYTKRGWVKSEYLVPELAAKSNFKFSRNPLDTKELTQRFGEDSDLYSRWGLKGHHGLDFRTRDANGNFNQRVYAVLTGKVLEASENDNNGRFVRLEHEGKSQTVYLHLDSFGVKTGEDVSAGQEIGVSGNTGFSGGPHLHFGYRPQNFDLNNGYKGYVDPKPFLV